MPDALHLGAPVADRARGDDSKKPRLSHEDVGGVLTLRGGLQAREGKKDLVEAPCNARGGQPEATPHSRTPRSPDRSREITSASLRLVRGKGDTT